MTNEFNVLPRSRMFELYSFLNKENQPAFKAVAVREIDIAKIEEIRSRTSHREKRPTYTSFVAKAAAQALMEIPEANRVAMRSLFAYRLIQFNKAHISIAVERDDADRNLKAAFIYTIYDTASKSLVEISKEINGLATAALDSDDIRLERWRRIKRGVKWVPLWLIKLAIFCHRHVPSLYIQNRGGAVLISSPSKYGVDFIVAQWPYPIGLSFGFAKDRPWVKGDRVVIKKTMTITMAFDRRILPGGPASRFMNRVCEILENDDD
ncbi:MAG: 2-oxo acid dehydrogenase subunit E2 [Bdellovibrionaceae bacterium]|nr:2-oxo acid dehydrogenase subunit E2 [Pseudobdellovibrionaceae bacterium]